MTDPNHNLSVDEDKLNDLLDLLWQECKAFKFNTAKGTIRDIITEMPGVKQSATVLKNALTSAQEGLRDGATTKVVVLQDLRNEFDDFRMGLEKVIKNIKSPPPTSFEEGLEQDLNRDLNRDPLAFYQKDMNVVQTRMTKQGGIFAGFVAVLPIAAPMLEASKLNRKGIPAERFAGYCILNKQFVAGISNDYIRSHSSTPGKDGASPRRMDKTKGKPEAILQEFKDVIAQRYKHLHLQEAAEPISWWDATWFWYIAPKELEAMRHCTVNDNSASRIHFKKWSFPFVKK